LRWETEDAYLFVVTFKEDGVEENGSSDKNTLLIGGCILGEGNVEGLGISKQLRHQTLRFLHDLSKERSVTIRAGLIRSVKAERLLAASFAARISFSTAVDANTTKACGGVHEVELFLLLIENLERWDTEEEERRGIRDWNVTGTKKPYFDYLPVPASLFDPSQAVVVTAEGCFLVAAAFTAAHRATQRTID
jgi:hypothetical protein